MGPARGLHRSGTETGFGGDLMLMKTVEGKGHGTNTESMARYSLDSEHCSLLSLCSYAAVFFSLLEKKR